MENEKKELTGSSPTSKAFLKIQIDRLYLLAGKDPPSDKVMDYLSEEARNFWKNIPEKDLPEAINMAILKSAPHMATIPYVKIVWDKRPGFGM